MRNVRDAALSAQRDAYRERAEMEQDLKLTSRDNRMIAEHLRKLMAERDSLTRLLNIANGRTDETAQKWEELRSNILPTGPLTSQSKEGCFSSPPTV